MKSKDYKAVLWGKKLAILTVGVLLLPYVVRAQDEPIELTTQAISSTRSSPFNPPSKDVFVTDDGPGLDTGCTFNTSSNHPLIIDVLVNRFVGEVDANGFLVNPGPLIAKGLIPATVDIIMPAFDVDFNGTPPPERDEVLFNGEGIGLLNGDNQIWLLNSFKVDIRKVKFPAEPPPGAKPAPVANRIQINVDLLARGRWCTAIDWVALVIPIRPEIGLTLEVKSGNKIRQNTSENTIDIIYKQSFDADCNVTVDIGSFDEYPFSGQAKAGLFGPSSGEAKLRTKVAPCPANSISDPEVKVEWEILGTPLKGIEGWTGFEGDVTIKMPDKVGSYTVKFTYTINGSKTITVSRKLFVTLRHPQHQVNPPRLVWYEKATDWASGTASDSEVLQKLLAGLYNYGEANWLYGYCFVGGAKLQYPFCVVNNVIDLTIKPTCSWEDLVADPITCNYADCYVFSDIFENMAATLGIGGLADRSVPSKPTGEISEWFVTTGAPSLDDDFDGNARPLGSTAPDRYLFTSHSLRKHGIIYYDATFNGIYSNETAFISWNLDGSTDRDANGGFYTTEEGAKIYPRPGYAYDSWRNYDYLPPPTPIVAENVAFVASTMGLPFQTLRGADTMNPQDIRFTGDVTFNTVDANGDGFFEAVAADVEVEIQTAGEYVIVGFMKKNGKTVANRPAFESMLTNETDISGTPGIYTASLRFSGEQILRSGKDGPYDLLLFAIGDSSDATLTAQTPPYDHTQFGEIGATIMGVSDAAIDEDDDGKFDFVETTLEVKVRTAGNYRLQGTLSKNDTSIVDAGDTFSLTPGSHTLKLRFPGRPIRRSGLDGPYEGVINIIDANGHTIGSIEFTTQPYSSATFGALLELDGRFKDQGIDTNGNGLFDILRIEFGADVREAGTFLVSGALKNPSEPLVVFTDVEMTLVTGPQTLTLDFAGPLIREQEIDGPYEVKVVVRDPNTFDELDRVPLGQMTAAYRFTDFDPLGVADIVLTGNSTDKGIDTNGNGLFDELRVEVEVELVKADFYEWSARLVDLNGTEIDFNARSGSLSAGIATITFVFAGNKIGEHGVDGPYFVKGLLIFGRTGPNLVATDVAKTQAYRFTEFEGAVLPPVADAGPDQEICFGDSVTIGGNPTAIGGTPPYTFSWTPTTGLDNATAANPKASPPGTTEYTVEVTDANGLKATDKVTVTINPLPIVNAGADKEICFAQTVTIGGNPTASGGTPPYTISWTPIDDLDSANVANPKVRPAATTTYTVEVTDAKGCKATDQVTVTVHNFVFFSKEHVRILREKNSSSKGDIHSNGSLRFMRGDPTTYYAVNLTAVGNIIIDKENIIGGDVTAGGLINLDESSSITGTATPNADVAPINLTPPVPFTAGGNNHVIPKNGSLTLPPGSYGEVVVGKSARLSLSSGDYFFNKFVTDSTFGSTLLVDVSHGPVNINVAGNLFLGKKIKIRITPSGEADNDQLTFTTLQSSTVTLDKGGLVLGTFIAPNAAVHIFNNCRLRGAVCAKRIDVERDVTFLHHTSSGTLPKEVDEDSDVETDEEASIVTNYELEQNYPNPLNPSTTIKFALPEAGNVTLAIYDINGHLVKTLVSGSMPAGRHRVVWNGTNASRDRVASGVYLYKLEANGFVAQKKLVLTK